MRFDLFADNNLKFGFFGGGGGGGGNYSISGGWGRDPFSFKKGLSCAKVTACFHIIQACK